MQHIMSTWPMGVRKSNQNKDPSLQARVPHAPTPYTFPFVLWSFVTPILIIHIKPEDMVRPPPHLSHCSKHLHPTVASCHIH